MKLLYWNARGVANLDTRLVLKNLILSNKPDFVFIYEPMILLDQFPSNFWSSLSLKVFAVNSRDGNDPNLWCVCLAHLNPVVIVSSYQHVSFSTVWGTQNFLVSAIYASTTYRARRSLWHELLQFQQSNSGPWCCIGDFNCILGAHEQRGQRLPASIACNEFKDWSDAANLIHVDTRGAEFTWRNGRRGLDHTERRLDRVLCNNDWLSCWTSSTCYTLIRNKSDHHPIVFDMQRDTETFNSSFNFLRMCSSHLDCLPVIADSWNAPVLGCPMFILAQKLKNLKVVLKVWNKDKFGDVNKMVDSATKELEDAQAQISEAGLNEDLAAREHCAQIKLNKSLHLQEEFWKEKSRVNWHRYGDRNTTFFHRVTKIKQATNMISILRNGDQVFDTAAGIESHILDFYKGLFASENHCFDNGLIEEIVVPKVSQEDNEILTKLPT